MAKKDNKDTKDKKEEEPKKQRASITVGGDYILSEDELESNDLNLGSFDKKKIKEEKLRLKLNKGKNKDRQIVTKNKNWTDYENAEVEVEDYTKSEESKKTGKKIKPFYKEMSDQEGEPESRGIIGDTDDGKEIDFIEDSFARDISKGAFGIRLGPHRVKREAYDEVKEGKYKGWKVGKGYSAETPEVDLEYSAKNGYIDYSASDRVLKEAQEAEKKKDEKRRERLLTEYKDLDTDSSFYDKNHVVTLGAINDDRTWAYSPPRSLLGNLDREASLDKVDHLVKKYNLPRDEKTGLIDTKALEDSYNNHNLTSKEYSFLSDYNNTNREMYENTEKLKRKENENIEKIKYKQREIGEKSQNSDFHKIMTDLSTINKIPEEDRKKFARNLQKSMVKADQPYLVEEYQEENSKGKMVTKYRSVRNPNFDFNYAIEKQKEEEEKELERIRKAQAPQPDKDGYIDVEEQRLYDKKLSATNLTAIKSSPHTGNYIVIDPQGNSLLVYDKDGNLLMSTDKIATGESKQDYETKTYTEKGKLINRKGNMSTPAGISKITKTWFNQKTQRESFNRKPLTNNEYLNSNNSPSAIHFGNPKNGTNGCINIRDPKVLAELRNYIKDNETYIYTLPNDERNRFVIENGNLSFKSKDAEANKGNLEKQLNTYTNKNTSESKIDYDKETIVNAVLDKQSKVKTVLGDSKQSRLRLGSRVRASVEEKIPKYIEGISDTNIKEAIKKEYDFTEDDYLTLQKLALGIYGRESDFGANANLNAIGRATILRELVAERKEGSNTTEKIVEAVGKMRKSELSLGETAIKFKTNGISLFSTSRVGKLLNSVGITDRADLADITSTGKITIALLADILRRVRNKGTLYQANGRKYDEKDLVTLLYSSGSFKKAINKTYTPETNIYNKQVKAYGDLFKFKYKKGNKNVEGKEKTD